jgi:catechol 2,3-dioxygenase-like lactoylglutathione lyase family enzyme
MCSQRQYDLGLRPGMERDTSMTNSETSPRLTSLAPQLLVDDLDRSVAYYRDALGFDFGEPWEGFYAIGLRDGLELHLKKAPKDTQQPDRKHENEHLDAAAGVDGIEMYYEQCLAKGAKIIRPLTSTDWGTKDFYIEDPDGNIISFGGK